MFGKWITARSDHKGTTHYAPYRRADATQDIYIVVGFCMLMFLSGMVVALMLIAEYQEYVRRTNHTTVIKKSGEQDASKLCAAAGYTIGTAPGTNVRLVGMPKLAAYLA
ncbi:hypothetical protein MTO96_036374 [Rhipicephalus appendiculatus]